MYRDQCIQPRKTIGTGGQTDYTGKVGCHSTKLVVLSWVVDFILQNLWKILSLLSYLAKLQSISLLVHKHYLENIPFLI